MHRLEKINAGVIEAPKGGTMFQVSEKASEMIKSYLKDKEENLAIRVLMQEGG